MWYKRKKTIEIMIGLFLVAGVTALFWVKPVLGAPTFSQERTLIPETDNLYDLGTTTKRWRGLYVNDAFVDKTLTATNLTVGTLTATSTTATSTFSGGLTVDTNTLVVDYSSSRVGIGTAAPTFPLEVVGPSGNGIRAVTVATGINAIQYSDGINYSVRGGYAAPAVGYIGGASGSAFALFANGTEKVRITTGGNVGIGTTTSTSLLSLYSSTGSSISLNTDASQSNTINFLEADLTFFGIQHDGGPSNPSNLLKIRSASGTNGLNTDVMTFTQAGNVGIGSTSPMAKLSVSSTGSDNFVNIVKTTSTSGISTLLSLAHEGTTNTGRGAGIKIKAPNSGSSADVVHLYGANDNTGGGGRYVIEVANAGTLTETFRINSSGNVGIGTTSPGQKLAVAGDILGNNIIGKYFTATSTTASTFPYASSTAQTISGSLYLSSLNGPLQANNGLVSATTSIGVLYGGTGLTSAPSYGQVLLGNSSGGYTLTATSSLGLAITGSGTTGQLPYYAANGTTLTATSSIFLATSGNVGIGTTTPGSKLEVFGGDVRVVPTSGASLPYLSIEASGTTGINFQVRRNDNNALTRHLHLMGESSTAGHVAIGTTTIPDAKLAVTGSGATTGKTFSLLNSTNTENLTVLDSGLVGIGTTSPQSLLEVAGAVAAGDGTASLPSFTFASSPTLGFYKPSAFTLAFTSNGSDRWMSNTTALFGSSGGSALSGSFHIARDVGTASAPTYSFGGDTNTGIYRFTTDSLSVVTSGSDRIVVTSTGNVGIGTTTPQQKTVIAAGTTGAATTKTSLLLDATYSDVSSGNALDFSVNGWTNAATRIVTNTAGSNGELAFYTNSNFTSGSATEKLRIASSGNVGIGTTTPGQLLDVYQGSIRASHNTLGAALIVSRGATNQSGYVLHQTGLSNRWTSGLIGNSTDDYAISTDGTASGAKLYIERTSGEIGIGTTTPGYLLELHSGSTDRDLFLDPISTSGVGPRIGTNYGQGSNIDFYSGSTGSMLLNTNFSTGQILLSPGTSGSVVMSTTTNQKVGIGTSTPAAKLDIYHTVANAALFVDGGASGATIAQFARRSGAHTDVFINGAGGDPQLVFARNGTTGFALGDDGGTFKLSASGAVGTTDALTVSSAGVVTATDSIVTSSASATSTFAGGVRINGTTAIKTGGSTCAFNFTLCVGASTVNSGVDFGGWGGFAVLRSTAAVAFGANFYANWESAADNDTTYMRNSSALGASVLKFGGTQGSNSGLDDLYFYATTTATGLSGVKLNNTNDLKFMIQGATGNIGIGKTNLTNTQSVDNPDATLTIGATSLRSTDNHISLRSLRLAISAGDQIGGIGFVSADSNITSPGATTTAIKAIATAVHTGSVWDTALTFHTAKGSVLYEQARLTEIGNLGLGTTTPFAKLSIAHDSLSTAPAFLVSTSTATATSTAFIIDSQGKVGISTSTPNRNLNIKDTLLLEPRAAAPTEASLGDLYVDSTTAELCFYDGSSWTGLKAGGTCE